MKTVFEAGDKKLAKELAGKARHDRRIKLERIQLEEALEFDEEVPSVEETHPDFLGVTRQDFFNLCQLIGMDDYVEFFHSQVAHLTADERRTLMAQMHADYVYMYSVAEENEVWS
jgi:hypothetical protein